MRITLEQSLDVANEALSGCMVRLKELTKLHQQLRAEIVNLKAELEKHRWIPVTERLPEKSDIYQALREINRYPTSREYCAKSLMWVSRDTVTHWKPIILPE